MTEKVNRVRITLIFIVIFSLTFLWANLAGHATEPEKSGMGQNEDEHFLTAYKFHTRGELEKAIHFYKLSIEEKPTAKAHTFLGWALSHYGKYDEAITECLEAIKLDPDFGNPYNDIGAYYIEKGIYDEAIPYLEKAIKAKNYQNYEFAHFNLGRVYVAKAMYYKAREKFEKALEINPYYLPAAIYLKILSQYLMKGI